MKWSGVVKADIIELRFAFSGKVISINKKLNDLVKSGEVIASLDRKVLQTELDRQLADYEKVRAQFELFKTRQDTDKFSQQISQSELGASVKDVELSKLKLDQAELICPIDGSILDTAGLRCGLYVTPSSNSVKILDKNSLRFVFRVEQNYLQQFMKPVPVIVTLNHFERKIEGVTTVPIIGEKGEFEICVSISSTDDILPGLSGEVICLQN